MTKVYKSVKRLFLLPGFVLAYFLPSDLLIPSRISRLWPRRRLFHLDVTRNLFLLLLRF